jgi:hypothetical protein
MAQTSLAYFLHFLFLLKLLNNSNRRTFLRYPSKIKSNIRLLRYISDFKENCLYDIYRHCTFYLSSFFKNELSFENFEYSLLFFAELAKCLNVCLDYEDDINYKDDINLNKYNLKPAFVPNVNQRRRGKIDKRLDVSEIDGIVKNLFSTYELLDKVNNR